MIYFFLLPLFFEIFASCDIQCWLNSLVLIVPDQSIDISVGQFNITNLICRNITLGKIGSSVNNQSHTIFASVGGIAVNCDGNWAYEIYPLGPYGNGVVTVGLSNSSLQLAMQIHEASDGLVSSVNVTNCQTHMRITTLNFEGGLSGWILDLFRSSIISFTEQAINDETCKALTNLINTNLTNLILGMNEDIRPYIHPKPPPPPPIVPPGMVNFTDNPILELLDFVLNTAVGASGPLGLNRIFSIITNETGNLTIAGTESMRYTISTEQINVTFGVLSISLSGLNTWEDFDVFKASQNYTLNSFTDLELLDLNVSFYVNLTFNQSTFMGSSVYEEALIILKLSENRLNTTFQVALNSSKVNTLALQTPQLAQLSCLLETLYSFNATQTLFNLTLGEIRLLAMNSGVIEEQFDALIDSILQIFIYDYADIVVPFFNGVISGPLREQLNQYVYEYIVNQTAVYHCELTPTVIPIPVPATGIVNLQNSTLVNVTDFLSNKVVGVNGPLGLNKIISAITNGTGIFEMKLNDTFVYSFPLYIPMFLTEMNMHEPLNLSFSVGISKILIHGLDTWKNVNLLLPENRYFLHSLLEIEEVELEVVYFLNISQIQEGQLPHTLLHTDGKGIVKTSGNVLNTSMVLALLEEKTNGLLNRPTDALQLGCIVDSIFQFNLTSLVLNSKSIILRLSVNSTTNITLELDQFVQNMISGAGVYGMVTLTQMANAWMKNVTELTPCEPVVPLPPLPVPKNTSFVNFTHNPFVESVQGMAEYVVGVHGVNRAINILTNGTNRFAFSNLANLSVSLFDILLELEVKNLTLSGLDNWKNLTVLNPFPQTQRPVDEFSLLNSLASTEVTITVFMSFYLNQHPNTSSIPSFGEPLLVEGAFNITTSLDMLFATRILMNETKLQQFLEPYPQVLFSANCSLKTLYDVYVSELSPGIGIQAMSLSVGNQKMQFADSPLAINTIEHLLTNIFNFSLRNEANVWAKRLLIDEEHNVTCNLVPPTPYAPLIPDNDRIVNFTNSSLLDLVNFVTNELVGTEGPFGINRLMNVLSNNSGVLVWKEMDPMHPVLDIPVLTDSELYGNLSLSIMVRNAYFVGVNNFTSVQLFTNSEGRPHQLTSLLELDRFYLNVEFSLNASLLQQSIHLPDVIKISLLLNSLTLNASTAVGVYLEDLQQVIANYSKWNSNCFLGSLQSAYFKHISFHPDLGSLVVSIRQPADASHPDLPADKVHNYNFSLFLSQLSQLAHSIAASPVRDEVNSLLNAWVQSNCTPAVTPPPPPIPHSDVVILDDNPAVEVLNYFTNDLVGVNGVFNVSYITRLITNHTGIFQFHDLRQFGINATNFTVVLPLPSKSNQFAPLYWNTPFNAVQFVSENNTAMNASITVTDFSIAGLDRCDSFDLFTNSEERHDSKFTLFSQIGFKEMDLNVTAIISIDGNENEKPNKGFIRFKLANLEMNNSMQLILNRSKLIKLYTNNPVAWMNFNCILDGVDSVYLNTIGINVTLTEIEYDFPNADPPLAAFINSTGWDSALQTLVQSLVQGAIREQVNAKLEELIHRENSTCPYYPPVSFGSVEYLSLYLVIALAIFFSMLLIAMMVYARYKDKIAATYVPSPPDNIHARGFNLNLSADRLSTLPNTPVTSEPHTPHNELDSSTISETDRAKIFSEEYDPASEGDILLDKPIVIPEDIDLSPSIAFHPRLHWAAQGGIPLAIIFTIMMYLTANTSIGASVTARITVGNESVWTDPSFQFTLMNSVTDMWKAGVYPLSLLILLFSGIWPYLKLFMLMFAWFVYPRMLSVKKREMLLMVLDALQKWSLIDVFVLIMMLVAFRLHLQTPTAKGQMDIFILPGWGFYAFLIATVMTLVLTHMLLYFHRQASSNQAVSVSSSPHLSGSHDIGALGSGGIQFHSDDEIPNLSLTGAINQRDEEEDDPLAAIPLAFRGRRDEKRAVTIARSITITTLLIFSLILVIMGSIFVAFEFKFGGLVRVVLEYLNYTTSHSYSVYTLGHSIPESYVDPNDFGIRLIQSTFFLFANGVPVIHLVALILLWNLPLRYAQQRILFLFCEVANAWASLEVFVLSIIVALVELDQFAQFMVGDKCDLINYVLVTYFPNSGTDGRCFSVTTYLRTGCWTLFSACIIYIISSLIVMRICHTTLSKNSNTI